MVDMSIDMEKREEEAEEQSEPVYPYGLCICLTHEELEKLELTDDCQVGDLLHMLCMARVTSVSKSENATRIEMQIIDIEALEDENLEAPGANLRPERLYR